MFCSTLAIKEIRVGLDGGDMAWLQKLALQTSSYNLWTEVDEHAGNHVA
jgi:hypothetical protein